MRPTPDPNRSCSTLGRVWDVYTPFALRSRDSGLWPLIENHNIYKSEHPAFAAWGRGHFPVLASLSLRAVTPVDVGHAFDSTVFASRTLSGATDIRRTTTTTSD